MRRYAHLRDEANLDGCEVLKLPVGVLDDVLRLRPIRGGVDADLVVLICREQLGAVQRVEISCGGGGTSTSPSKCHADLLGLELTSL